MTVVAAVPGVTVAVPPSIAIVSVSEEVHVMSEPFAPRSGTENPALVLVGRVIASRSDWATALASKAALCALVRVTTSVVVATPL